MEYIEYIGPYIRYMREKQNLDIGDFCIACDITRIQLHNIESGKCDAHPNTLKRLLDHLGIDFISLFRNQNDYKIMIDNLFQALMYDNVAEQEILMARMEKISFEYSVLFPEYLLVRLFYVDRHEHDIEKIAILLSKLEIFMEVMLPKYQFIYNVFKGIYHEKRNELDLALKVYAYAEDLPNVEFRELLYYQYGKLYTILHKNVKALSYFEKASDLYTKKWNINCMLYTKVYTGICYIHMREYEIAQERLLETITLARQYKNDYALMMCCEMLAKNYLLKKEYANCIQYAKQGLQIAQNYDLFLFYIAYSYFKLKDYGSAALWAGKRDEFDKSTRMYKLLYYVKQLLDKNIVVHYLEDLLSLERHTKRDDLSIFILNELCECYHNEQSFEEEVNCLRQILHFDY